MHGIKCKRLPLSPAPGIRSCVVHDEGLTPAGSSSDSDLRVPRLGLIPFLLQPLGLHVFPELLLKLLLSELSQLSGVCVRLRPYDPMTIICANYSS